MVHSNWTTLFYKVNLISLQVLGLNNITIINKPYQYNRVLNLTLLAWCCAGSQKVWPSEHQLKTNIYNYSCVNSNCILAWKNKIRSYLVKSITIIIFINPSIIIEVDGLSEVTKMAVLF